MLEEKLNCLSIKIVENDTKLLYKEEIKAKQRFRHTDIKEDARNTAYFHAVANKSRRKHISSLSVRRVLLMRDAR